jgi:hypothetical protein
VHTDVEPAKLDESSGLVFADFYCQLELDTYVNTVEFYGDILHVESAVLSGTCVFLFRSWMKDIFISSNVTQNIRNALLHSILRAFVLPLKTSPPRLGVSIMAGSKFDVSL